jgi:NtrC-family two-component system sensor histidine kinase KinB
MTLSLRRRILFTVTPLLFSIAGLGVAGAVLLTQLGQRSDAILRENYDSVRAMTRLAGAAERIDSSFRSALAGTEEDARATYRVNWEEYRRQLEIEGDNVTILPDEQRLVAELRRLTADYEGKGERFFGRPAGDGARGADYFGGEARHGLLHSFREIERVAGEIHDLNERQMQKASRDAKATARVSVVGFLTGLAFTALLAVVAVWWLHRAILGPIQSVTRAAQAIGGGKLQLMVPVYGADELGQLAESFNAMTRTLRAYRQSDTERLLRARRMGRATIDSFPDPVIVLDLLGRVESANPAAQRLLGVTPPADSEPPPEWQPHEQLRQAVADALQRQRPTLAETFDQVLTFREGGDERQFLPQVRPIRSSEGETLGAAVVLNDVTRFRLLDRLKSDWVATVSHELKTPLTSVRLAVHVLLEEVVGPLEPKQTELLVEARDSTERLLRLIEYLLALARLEDGRERLEPRPTDPTSLLRAAADAAASRAEDRRIEIALHDEPGLPPVEVDPDRLGRALNNLLDNALTYTEAGGKVVLSATATPDGRVCLGVSDTGIGIPAEHLPHVFDRFFRVPGRDERPGTGLGLAIVREIVAAHHGEIACESEPGHGTTFRITLPAAKDAT